MKTCSRCQEEKPATPEFFYQDRTKNPALSSVCRPCRKADQAIYRKSPKGLEVASRYNKSEGGLQQTYRTRRLKNFGMTPADFDAMLLAQDGKCGNAGCGKALSETAKFGSPNKLHLDHDHATGKVRGALCSPCNLALGMLKDSPKRARGLADYLERFL